jgi:predicted AlkP superfamily phosphohydrolase/phosphomutase
MGFVYVNLAGRGPLGIVQPGSEYESIIIDLITRFREIRHPRTGEHLLFQVVPGRNIYPAAETGVAVPDLVLVPREGYNFSFAVTEAAPKASEEGTHRHNGVFIIKGDAISDPGPNFQPDLIDVTPTILHCLDLPVPTDLDGRVLRELLASDGDIHYEEVDNRQAFSAVGGYTRQEEDIVAQRLTGLGYLE